MTITNLGQPSGATNNIVWQVVWVANTWFAASQKSAGISHNSIFKWTGSAWTEITNSSDLRTNGEYKWLAVSSAGGSEEIWTGTSLTGSGSAVWSYNPATDTWTDRGGSGEIASIIAFGSTVAYASVSAGGLFYWNSGTSWTASPGFSGNLFDLAAIGDIIYVGKFNGFVSFWNTDTNATGNVGVAGGDSSSFTGRRLIVRNNKLIASARVFTTVYEQSLYEYDTSWTQLGSTKFADGANVRFLTESSGNLYTSSADGTADGEKIYEYDSGWSQYVDTGIGSSQVIWRGEFNPSDTLGFGADNGTVYTYSAKALSGNPASMSFPNTAVGCSSVSQTFTITNTGSGNVTITAFDTGTEFGSDFSGPQTLTPLSTLDVEVHFAPTSTGAKAYAATLTSDAGTSPTLNLSGTGYIGLRDLTIRKLNGDGFLGCEMDAAGIKSKTNYMHGNIGEALVFEGKLSDEDREKMTDFLKEKWGIS